MVILREEDNFILIVEIIIWEILREIRNKDEVYINGQGNNQIYTKDNLKIAKEMVEVSFGGQMAADIRVISRMEFNQDMV
jgi:hypothetical protein